MWKLVGVKVLNDKVIFELVDYEEKKDICTDYDHLPNEVKPHLKEEVGKWLLYIQEKISGIQ